MSKKIFYCKNCSKTFSRKFNLEKHINLKRCKGMEYSKIDEYIDLLKTQNKFQSKKIIKLEDEIKLLKNITEKQNKKIDDLAKLIYKSNLTYH
jgi:uncharacterized Zn-finger protein